MEHSVVRTDNMSATYNGAKLRSIQFATKSGDVYTNAQIENGNVALVDAVTPTDRDVHYGVAPAANSPLNKIVLIATPEVITDERKHNLDEFTNEKNKLARGYLLNSGDIFSVTSNGVTTDGGTSVKSGMLVELQAGTKLKIVGTATANSTQVGEIIDVETVGSYIYYVILVA